LLASVAMMAIPTVLMGVLPTYATIGVAASFLIVLLRMFQGMAVGGEFTSSIVFLAERAPPNRRGFFASTSMFGATTGTMLGAAVGAALSRLLSPEALASWGWRAAFVSGIVVAVVAIIIRRNLFDTPAAVSEVAPLRLVVRHHRTELLRIFGLNIAPAATYYTLFVYAATWIAESTAVERATALDLTTFSILTFLVVVLTAGYASDRFGRKRLMVIGMTACLVLAYPLVWLMNRTDVVSIAAAQMLFSGLLAVYMAPIPALMCETFPHAVRVSAVSVGYGLAYAIFGGTAPAVAVWLINRTGSDVAFVWYLMALTAISLTLALTTRERRGEPLV
jgi:MFS transporter, MHS family, proline/betaine transporter